MELNGSECVGCGACYSVCQKNSIEMKRNKEGFLYPKVNIRTCINCHKCEKVCPLFNSSNENKFNKIVYACHTKNEEIRFQSSSGGIFTEVAQMILKQDGVVFGASLSDDFMSVRHIAVDNINDLKKLRGSKYVQSNIGDTYRKAEEYLKQNRTILFTGTPCQIAGLKGFLGKDYNNLFTQDFICHGVPSPFVWKKYVKHRKCKAKSNVECVSFRNKKNGWKHFNIEFKFANGTEYVSGFLRDIYMQGFLKNFYLRESCYNCRFKNGQGNSDITLADFWGIESVIPEMDDDKGASIAIINSKKGEEVFDIISDDLVLRKIEMDYVNKYNVAYVKSVDMPQIREKIFRDIRMLGIYYGIKMNLNTSIIETIVLKLKRILILIYKALFKRHRRSGQ